MRRKKAATAIILFITIIFAAGTVTNADSDYTVKTGDTLWKIANEKNITIEQIMEANENLDSYQLHIGQTLRLPEDEKSSGSEENYYTVKTRDILWTIARSHNTTVERLMELNDLNSSTEIHPGQQLLINENARSEEETSKPNNPFSKFITPYTFYKVEEGDNIFTIAGKFDIRVMKLVKENNIRKFNSLEEGDLLVIPLRNSDEFRKVVRQNRQLNNFYRVQGEESLSDIAEYYGIPAEIIIHLNNLDDEGRVYSGQSLKMPVSPAFFTEHKLYTVRENNKPIHEIAYQNDISIRSILKANYLSDINSRFRTGTRLIIPLDEESEAVWIDYEDGKPVNSWFH
ncbi:MAG: LysM peptidoglycan-binding domain-containing protein [Halanaerobiaceae bacterium]